MSVFIHYARIYTGALARLVRKDLFEFARLRATDENELKIIRYRYLPNIIIRSYIRIFPRHRGRNRGEELWVNRRF